MLAAAVLAAAVVEEEAAALAARESHGPRTSQCRHFSRSSIREVERRSRWLSFTTSWTPLNG